MFIHKIIVNQLPNMLWRSVLIMCDSVLLLFISTKILVEIFQLLVYQCYAMLMKALRQKKDSVVQLLEARSCSGVHKEISKTGVRNNRHQITQSTSISQGSGKLTSNGTHFNFPYLCGCFLTWVLYVFFCTLFVEKRRIKFGVAGIIISALKEKNINIV